jgi:hypothetical protein
MEACGGAGITKAVAFMERSQQVLERKQACITRLRLIALEQDLGKVDADLPKRLCSTKNLTCDIYRARGLERPIALR